MRKAKVYTAENSHIMPDGTRMLNSEHEKMDAAYLGTLVSDAATFIFGNATQRMKNFMKDHGDEEITNIQIGRVPIESAISSAMNLISLGKFDETKKNKGYDEFFHLYLIINDKYRLEKNQTVNVIKDYKEQPNEERYNVSLSGLKGKTINDFIANGVNEVGEANYWGNYSGLTRNCQWWVMNNLKGNGIYDKDIEKFTLQDTEELQLEMNDYVKAGMDELTQTASALDKFVSWLSGGLFGLKRGGRVRRRIGF
jgi:hypothetical protein